MALEDDFSNLSLSTAELEPNDGDILHDKSAVWAQAGELCCVTASIGPRNPRKSSDFDQFLRNCLLQMSKAEHFLSIYTIWQINPRGLIGMLARKFT